jgi:hypothetical protein
MKWVPREITYQDSIILLEIIFREGEEVQIFMRNL